MNLTPLLPRRPLLPFLYHSRKVFDNCWNPWLGCSRSAGPACANCTIFSIPYVPQAPTLAPIASPNILPALNQRAKALNLLARRGVGSFCDPFDPAAPSSEIQRMLHTLHSLDSVLFMFQTRYPARANKHLAAFRDADGQPFPLQRTMLMVSAEDHQRVADRLPPLVESPAAFRALRIDPLLASVDLRRFSLEGVHWILAGASHSPKDPAPPWTQFFGILRAAHENHIHFYLLRHRAKPHSTLNKAPLPIRVRQFPIPRRPPAHRLPYQFYSPLRRTPDHPLIRYSLPEVAKQTAA
jgi:protein gp37